MATASTIGNMLQEYITNKMLMAEYVKRDWALSNVEMVTGWHGGNANNGKLIVPFDAGSPSSISLL